MLNISQLIGFGTGGVTPGSQTFTTSGSHQFSVPEYNTLTVELWGAGAAGAAAVSGAGNGQNGGATTIVALGMTAGGGVGGTKLDPDLDYRQFAAGGAGGTASGGNTLNTSGSAGSSGYEGGSAANGGAGGTAPYIASNTGPTSGGPGSAPGGGGGAGHYDLGGNWLFPGAGGGGSYSKSVYTPGTGPAHRTLLDLVVGAGGAGQTGNPNGNGAVGRIVFTWS